MKHKQLNNALAPKPKFGNERKRVYRNPKQTGQHMQTTNITSKGQITIPAEIRKSLHLTAGQKVNVSCENNVITITPIQNDISAVFGMLKATKSASLAQMEEAIAQAACGD